MEHLRNLLRHGACLLASSQIPRDYDVPKRGDFAIDAKNLAGDVKAVAGDLRRNIDKQAYGK